MLSNNCKITISKLGQLAIFSDTAAAKDSLDALLAPHSSMLIQSTYATPVSCSANLAAWLAPHKEDLGVSLVLQSGEPIKAGC